MINGGFISGKSSRLKRAVTSSTGAEVYALSAAAHEVVSVRNQLRELQHGVDGDVHTPRRQPELHPRGDHSR